MVARAGTPGYVAQLRLDRQLATTVKQLESLRDLGKRYQVALAKSTTGIDPWRAAVVKKLDDLIASETNKRSRRCGLQGRSLSLSSSATASSRRCSVSSAAPRRPIADAALGAAEGGACKGAVGGQGPEGSVTTPRALPSPSATYSSVLVSALTPPVAIAALLQDAALESGGGARCGAQAPRHASSDYSQLMQQQLEAAQQQLSSQQQQVAKLEERLAAAEYANRQLKQQLQVTHAVGLRHTDQLAATEQQLQELMAAHMQQAETRDSVSKLYSRQEQLQQRQKLDECQLCVVFKTTTPLPMQGTATHLQQLLAKQLQLNLTVQRVQPLGGKQHSSDCGDNTNRRHAYKITLGSGGERTAVLRAKAQHLRGTTLSIDALLTPEQLASRQLLMPVARQAKAAGQAVRWRYGELLIDGKAYTGPGSLPSPAEQLTAAASGSRQQHMSVAQSRIAVDADGFQQVQSRRSKQQQKGSTAPKPQQTAGATSMQQPKQQQKGGSAPKQQPKQQLKSSKAPKQKQKGSTTPSQHQRGSALAAAASKGVTPAASDGSQQQLSAGGAGGAPARVASQGQGKEGSSAPQTRAVAGHGGGPLNAKAPPAAAASDNQQPAPMGDDTAVAGSGGPAPSPPSSTRA